MALITACSQSACLRRDKCARAVLMHHAHGDLKQYTDHPDHDGCSYFIDRGVGERAGWYPKPKE